MKKAGDMAQQIAGGKKLYSDEATSAKPQRTKGISPSIWIMIWIRLEAAGVVWDELDSTTSEYWRVSLDGYSQKDLERGCDGADDWTKPKRDFTLGSFKFLCRKPHSNGSYKIYEKLPHKGMPKGELKKRIAKMREELGI